MIPATLPISKEETWGQGQSPRPGVLWWRSSPPSTRVLGGALHAPFGLSPRGALLVKRSRPLFYLSVFPQDAQMDILAPWGAMVTSAPGASSHPLTPGVISGLALLSSTGDLMALGAGLSLWGPSWPVLKWSQRRESECVPQA